MKLDATPLLCTNCGWKTEYNKFVAEYFKTPDLACKACTSTEHWKKLELATGEEKENMLWKRLLYVENRDKFQEGAKFNLDKRERKVQEYLNDSVWVRDNPRIAADLRRMRGQIDMEFADDHLKGNNKVE
jgi:hypothetical protein